MVLRSINKIFEEHFLGNRLFRLVAILKGTNKIFEKQLQENPSERHAVLNLSAKFFKNTYEGICILESISVSMYKIYEIHL